MLKLYRHLDKTYVLYVLHKTEKTAYEMSKATGISQSFFSDVKKFKHDTKWEKIHKLWETTSIAFLSPEHMQFSIEYMQKHPELFDDGR